MHKPNNSLVNDQKRKFRRLSHKNRLVALFILLGVVQKASQSQHAIVSNYFVLLCGGGMNFGISRLPNQKPGRTQSINTE